MNTAIDKSIYGQIKTKGEQLAELVKMAENIQNNNDKNAAEAYHRGLDDAWEAARKIVDMWDRIDNDELLAIFGITERIGYSTIIALFGKQTASEALEKLKAYEEKQNDKIEVGDEVKWHSNVIVVTRLYKDGVLDWCDGIGKGGRAFHVLAENVRKTGRHFDIASILEDMRND